MQMLYLGSREIQTECQINQYLYRELRVIGRSCCAMFGLSVDFFSMATIKPVVNNVGTHGLDSITVYIVMQAVNTVMRICQK